MVAPADQRHWSTDHAPAIEPLRESDFDLLRLRDNPRVGELEVGELLRRWPNRSVWSRNDREFVLMAPWRHRTDISVVHALSAIRAAVPLVRDATERCRAMGDALMLMIEFDELRHPRFYEKAGLDLIEEVVTYELDRPKRQTEVDADLRFDPFDPDDEQSLDALVELDHLAFPWLWWNSRREFEMYAMTPGVEVYLGRQGDRVVSYVGLTHFGGWGHLDRIAVNPAAQGRGLGAASLSFVIDRLVRRGARRIGLSTQRENTRSRQLYQRFGFRRAREHDYRLYGARLGEPAFNVATHHRPIDHP